MKRQKIRLIHCDEYPLFRQGLGKALSQKEDIELIGGAENGQELMELLDKTIPDIIILNITMPILNGIGTFSKIKEKYPEIKIIVLSMHTDRNVIIKMMKLGAGTFLTKDTEGEEIYQAIKCVNEYNYYYSEAIERAFLGSNLKVERTMQRSDGKV